jgi:hypothetical protein
MTDPRGGIRMALAAFSEVLTGLAGRTQTGHREELQGGDGSFE